MGEDISIHIFSTSAAMAGVCLTVLRLFKVIFQLRAVSTLGDGLLSVDALLFPLACVRAYRAGRTRGQRRLAMSSSCTPTRHLATVLIAAESLCQGAFQEFTIGSRRIGPSRPADMGCTLSISCGWKRSP